MNVPCWNVEFFVWHHIQDKSKQNFSCRNSRDWMQSKAKSLNVFHTPYSTFTEFPCSTPGLVALCLGQQMCSNEHKLGHFGGALLHQTSDLPRFTFQKYLWPSFSSPPETLFKQCITGILYSVLVQEEESSLYLDCIERHDSMDETHSEDYPLLA